MEGPRLLRKKNKVMPMQMHWVRDREEDSFALGDLLRRALTGDDQVDPVFF